MGKKKDKKLAKRAAKAKKKAGALALRANAPGPATTPSTPPAATPLATALSSAPPGHDRPAQSPTTRKTTSTQSDNRVITIMGREYTMALSFTDLADGEQAAIYKHGQHHANLLNLPLAPGLLRTLRDAFAMSLERFHPDIPFAERRSLLTWPTLLQVSAIIYGLFYPAEDNPKETSA